jgi:hypothetical protein
MCFPSWTSSTPAGEVSAKRYPAYLVWASTRHWPVPAGGYCTRQRHVVNAQRW